MRLADYFGAAFAKVSTYQFPWMKILKESSVAKMDDIPLSNIPEDIYKISVDWLNHLSLEALGAAKGSKRVVPQVPSRSQVSIFVVLAMILRCKPDVLISLLPIIKENAKYEGQEKLPVLVWIIIQACQSDLVAGMLFWVHFLFPVLNSKSNSNPQSRDLILQVVERIISFPMAHAILVNGSVRKRRARGPRFSSRASYESDLPRPFSPFKGNREVSGCISHLERGSNCGCPWKQRG
ncbi:Protein of unknown function DUF2359 [Abeliophyllum distichum]|uniref:Uncharacterized protein n=1 Tax=Abeliophyllum distichum TaxID=126358 RepID=A0ABD1SH38_9LAMI